MVKFNILRIMKKIFFCILLLFFSCQKLIKYKDFELTKTSYTGNELRIDGYYYCCKPYGNDDNLKHYYLRCFYRNGILQSMGEPVLSSLEEADEYIRKNVIEGSPNPKLEWLKWGLFVINGQTIKMEYYPPVNMFTRWTYIREGTIRNDTTFHITVFYRSDGKERRDENEIYHFRQFSPKPDSTNNFIK